MNAKKMSKILIGGIALAITVVFTQIGISATTTSTSLDVDRRFTIGKNLRLITGTIDITSSDDTAEVTDITKYFTTVMVVLFNTSDKNYRLDWVATTNSIQARCMYFSGTMYSAGEGDLYWANVPDAYDIGSADFIAIGTK